MPELLHDALAQAVGKHREHMAVQLADTMLTYGELDDQSLRLAQILCEAGLQPGDRVAIHQLKSVEMLVGIYGILRAGGCFVPIDPMSPSARVEAILADCSVRAVVTDAVGYQSLQNAGRGGVTLVVHADDVTPVAHLTSVVHRSWSSVRAHESGQSLPRVTPDDLAYIMYTSGSTGPPKGMMHSHRSSLGFAGWGQRFCDLDAHDVVANLSPLHFDISVFDIFSSVLGASCVVLIPQRVQLFPVQVAKVLESTMTTVVFTVPYALARLATAGGLADRMLDSLRWVLFGGEPFQPSDLGVLMQLLSQARYANVYGPAEAPACVVHEISTAPTTDAPIPIGHLAPDTDGRIVEMDGVDPVASGTVGELLIASPSITLGYWNRPDLNSATRVIIDGHEYFRTGDLVERGPDDLLHFIGRNDRMIKSRGFRIELDEVEAAVASHSRVQEAAVFAVDNGGTKLVHAAIVPTDVSFDAGELTTHLADRLPSYAIPAQMHLVVEMPRTTSDKIDRRALAARYETGQA